MPASLLLLLENLSQCWYSVVNRLSFDLFPFTHFPLSNVGPSGCTRPPSQNKTETKRDQGHVSPQAVRYRHV